MFKTEQLLNWHRPLIIIFENIFCINTSSAWEKKKKYRDFFFPNYLCVLAWCFLNSVSSRPTHTTVAAVFMRRYSRTASWSEHMWTVSLEGPWKDNAGVRRHTDLEDISTVTQTFSIKVKCSTKNRVRVSFSPISPLTLSQLSTESPAPDMLHL